MIAKNYELIEHTADIGIRVKGNDLADLFKNVSLAMFDIIAEKVKDCADFKIKEFHMQQEAANPDELLINWLNELLSLSAAKQAIFYEFNFHKINEHNLQAVAFACDNKAYKVNVEIKAAIYHELEVKKSGSGWLAKVIFDV